MRSLLLALAAALQGPAISPLPPTPIAEVRRDADHDGRPDRLGDTVTVAGRATVGARQLQLRHLRAFVQDGTAGIQIYDERQVFHFGARDSLEVTGVVGEFRGQVELRVLALRVHGTPAGDVHPVAIPLTRREALAHEGELVTTRGRVVARGANDYVEYLVIRGESADSADRLVVTASGSTRVVLALERYEAGDVVEVTGIVSRFEPGPAGGAGPDPSHGVRIYARRAEDLQAVGLRRSSAGWIVLGMLLAAAVVVLWIALLRAQVRRQTLRLRESEQRLRSLSDYNIDAVFALHPDGTVASANAACAALIGDAESALVGRSVRQVVPSADHDRVQAHLSQALAGAPQHFATTLVRRGGAAVEVQVTFLPSVVDRRITGVFGIAKDVTAQLRAEQALRRREREFSALVEHAPDVIARFDADTRCLYVNPSVQRVVGAPAQALIGLTPREAGFPEAVTALWERWIAHVHATGEEASIEFELPTPSGPRWFQSRLTPEQAADGGAVESVLAVMRDLTEQRRVTEALRESELRFRQFAEHMRDVFYLSDPEVTRIYYVSPAYEAIWGRSRESLYAEPRSWLTAVHPDDVARVRAARQPGQPQEKELEFRILRPDGTIRWIRDRAFAVRDERGALLWNGGVAEDVTERNSLEQQFRQAQKMEAVGRLAGGIAHDFNNLLTVVKGSAELLTGDLEPGHAAHADAQEILRAADRASALTTQLLAFSRKQVLQPRRVDVNAIVADLLPMLGRLIGEDIEIVTRLGETPLEVLADRGQLEQALTNLAVNSRDAMPDGGVLLVEVREVKVTRALVHPLATVPEGEYVRLTVTDTGHGMDPETQARLFEPFFTTKEPGKGTGLGLATVYGIVQQSGGHIWVYSEPGRGTTFTIFLPRRRAADDVAMSNAAPALPTPAEPAPASETILLVEDEDAVRKLATRILERRGYVVLSAPNGGDALRRLRELDGRVDMILTDVVMPEMNGRELVQQVRQHYPGARVLYMSGYTDDDILRRGILEPGVTFLPKPFTARELERMIRAVLDSARVEPAGR